MITQINPALPVETPKGPGLAHFVIDYGHEHNLHWVVFLDSNGECWTYQNPQIRGQKNITQGRMEVTPIKGKEEPEKYVGTLR